MYNDILSGFCNSCLNKKVNEKHSVKDYILIALKTGEENNIMGSYMMIQGALATLEEGGCQACIGGLQRVVNILKS